MALIVQKFGGSSVADTARIRNVARIITETYRKGNNVVVVLSAQGDTTDDLIAKAEEINPGASRRVMDMLLATGEQISCSLCAMAIEALGYPVISLTGWQAGMLTNSAYGSARIKRIRTDRIQTELDARKIVLVAGFQGINKYDDITTLGRGGSDTSAVALSASMQICVRSTSMWTACTPPIPARSPERESWKRSPTTRCWNWPAWGRRCCTTARWKWPSDTTSIWRFSPASPGIRVRKLRRS